MSALRPVWTALRWQGLFYVLPFGRCGHVFGLLVRHTVAAGHNAFRGDGSRPQARARGAMAQMGFPALGIDRSVHYIAFALSKTVFRISSYAEVIEGSL